MKHRIGNYFRKSFSARFSLYVIAIVNIVFVVTFTLIYYSSFAAIKKGAVENAELTLKQNISSIEGILARISKSVDNITTIVQRESLPADSLYPLLERFVAANNDITGSAIAFEPHHYPTKGYYYSPYAYRDSTGIYTKQLGNESYDYFNMEWYAAAIKSERGYWTEPYYDEGGGKTVMCTYSSIMRDKDGRIIGVMTADISLDWLCDLVLSIKPYPNSYSFVLGRSGTYLVHHTRELVFNESIFSLSSSGYDSELISSIGKRMIQGQSGYAEITNGADEAYIFYAPVRETGWSMAMVNSVEDIFAEMTDNTHKILIIAAIGLLLIFIFCLIIIRKVSEPLKHFALSAQKIAHGNFNAKLPEIKTQDEMKELYLSFDYMKNELVKYIESLEETVTAKEKIESELRIARTIQMGMIPKIFPPFPDRNDVDLYAMLRPAKEVGGDLYDFFINNERLYFIIGDVSGKGVPASLFMAVARSLFRSIAVKEGTPQGIIASMNSAISESNDENMFITVFVGILDLQSGELEYCNAGHNPPVLIQFGKNVSFVNVHKNLPIGILPDLNYEKQSMTMNNGEVLFLYTDGLTEAENCNKELFGEERLLDMLTTIVPSTNTQSIVGHVLESVEEHVQEAMQSDDLTMLVVKFNQVEPRDSTVKEYRTLTINNQIAELGKLTSFIDEIGDSCSLSPDVTMSLNLAMEEAVTNVILYAYPQDGNDYSIDIQFTCENREMTFVIQDSGVPFDPTSKQDADITLSAEERPIGGLGIFLVRQIMTTISYSRTDGKNILTLTKKLE